MTAWQLVFVRTADAPLFFYLFGILFAVAAIIIGLVKRRWRPVIVAGIGLVFGVFGASTGHLLSNALLAAGPLWPLAALFVIAVVLGAIGLPIAGFVAALVVKSDKQLAKANARAEARAESAPPARSKGANPFAVTSVVVVWFSAVLGLIFGHIALTQISRDGATGRGMALTAVIYGWAVVALSVVTTAAIFIFFQR